MTSASQVHRAMRGEVCLGSKAARFSVGPPSTTNFDFARGDVELPLLKAGKSAILGLNHRNLANVGSDIP
jgi:hypothetical protein